MQVSPTWLPFGIKRVLSSGEFPMDVPQRQDVSLHLAALRELFRHFLIPSNHQPHTFLFHYSDGKFLPMGVINGCFSTDPKHPQTGIGALFTYNDKRYGYCKTLIKYNSLSKILEFATDYQDKITGFYIDFDPNQSTFQNKHVQIHDPFTVQLSPEGGKRIKLHSDGIALTARFGLEIIECMRPHINIVGKPSK